MNTRAAGARVERRALWWYRLRGWRILGTNVWVAGYELDLIARRGRRLAFVEVKAKTGPRFGDPLEMVTREKQRRIRQAAAMWLQSHCDVAHCTVQFDVVAERGGKLDRIALAFD